MNEGERWRRLWNEIDGALVAFGDAQAKITGRFLKDVRLAVEGYGRDVGVAEEVLVDLEDMEEES